MSDLTALLTAAIAGGAVSTAWKTFTSQRDLVRTTRVEIYRALLPTVYESGPSMPRAWCHPEARWDELFRAAESIGGKDWQHAARLRASVLQWHQQLAAQRRGDPPGERDVRWEVAVRRNLSDYEQWLHRRLAGWRRRPHPLLR